MNEAILSIRDLKVHYGGIEAVKGISFDVEEGSIVTLIGANGAGKSSTLRSIIGLVKPAGGQILFRGDDITNMDTNMIVRKGITLVPEGRRIFPDLTVLENLRVGAYLRNDDIITAVKENLDYLKPPLKDNFTAFVNDATYITSVEQAIKNLKSKVDDDIYREWCDALLQCQSDRGGGPGAPLVSLRHVSSDPAAPHDGLCPGNAAGLRICLPEYGPGSLPEESHPERFPRRQWGTGDGDRRGHR